MKNSNIEKLLPLLFEGTLSPEKQQIVEQWRMATEENQQIYTDSRRAWENLEQLRSMRKYNPAQAILQVNKKIEKQHKNRILYIFQKVAAILIFPLIAASLYFALDHSEIEKPFIAWHTLEIPAGMRSEFYLPDSTKVYLNSKTSLSYPLTFSSDIREVKLSGEAYFEVSKNKKVPFIVNTGKINIEVTGTEFIASNYPHEQLTEIVLIEGGINLFKGNYLTSKKEITRLCPGEKALYENNKKKLIVDKVNSDKYIAWKNGILMFRDDPMPEVVRRLNRWFNVDIQLQGAELRDWTYTATFEDESLVQILELLKLSAPIDYSIKNRKIQTDKTFSKMEIVIKQK
ncbi:FecR family protein [Mariniphaga anaerophila]|uniref:FecR family protein n=1 Tax=Mariniphaga anaerophila TaxID=1484053 RepID=A0A1M5BIS1_9BACT|nr:FecR domain-containing protein [Mariniphaga anaerophila]SHF42112.1 FecR family protein [Mariniphaga anaerophila]